LRELFKTFFQRNILLETLLIASFHTKEVAIKDEDPQAVVMLDCTLEKSQYMFLQKEP